MNARALIIAGGGDDGAGTVAGVPLTVLDVLGRPALLRVLDRLRQGGVTSATVVSDCSHLPVMPEDVELLTATDRLWQVASGAYGELTPGADLIFVIGVGPYAEINYRDLAEFHVNHGRPVTAAVNESGELMGAFVLSSPAHNQAAYLIRHQLKTLRHPHVTYVFPGYSNALRNVADLRRLAIDAFCGNAELTPEAVERRPGVWIARDATIDRGARIVAPAFIGARARICAGAVVTRCSAVEHHSIVGTGTVVDNATLLPNTKVGPGLDVAHAVVGLKRFAHLGRSIEVEITDPKLVGSVSTAPMRVLQHLAALATYLPAQFVRGFASSNGSRKAPELSTGSMQSPYPAVAGNEEFPANLAGARRYGND